MNAADAPFEIRDYEIVDYGITSFAGHKFRGPIPKNMEAGSYSVAVGAAQTFGRFCEKPYPTLLAEAIGLPAINMGVAGGGPEFFLRDDDLIECMNRARFVILQVMSATSQSNSTYECGGLSTCTLRRDGRHLPIGAVFEELLAGGHPALAALPLPARVRRKIGNLAHRRSARALVAELRAGWVASSLELLRRIEAPVVLLWFSKRRPAYRESYASRRKLFGEVPYLVTPEMLAEVRPHAQAYVECVTTRGSPQQFRSRFTGVPITEPEAENHYYPSPKMHEDAARALQGTCLRLLQRGNAVLARALAVWLALSMAGNEAA